MRKNPEVTDATRQTFLEAFCTLCKRKAVGKITIKAITTKAGYNRCTFYQYFHDVYELLAYIEDEVIVRIKENVAANITSKPMTEAFVLTFCNIHKAEEMYYDVLMKPENNAVFNEKLKREIAPLLIKKLGLPANEMKTEYIAEIYLSGVMAAVSRWVRSGRKIPSEELAALIKDLSIHGMWMSDDGNGCV